MVDFFCGLLMVFGVEACNPGQNANAESVPVLPKRYDAVIIRVVDGDTVVATARGSTDRRYVRLLGIDAPEIDGDCRNEILKAHHAKKLVTELLPYGAQVTLVSGRGGWRLDQYGRILARVEYEGRDVGGQIRAAGLARKWTQRPPKTNVWCGGAS